jgi:hypothetical protein
MRRFLLVLLLVIGAVTFSSVGDFAPTVAAKRKTPTPRETPAPTETATVPLPTDTPFPTATFTSMPTDAATPTYAPTQPPTATATPTFTFTPTKSPTNTPTNTPTPDLYEGLPKCSQALHDSYVAQGPDGRMYPTWHPLIDHEADGTTCSHRHEHGSNPALLNPNWHPLFGYAAYHMGMNEPNAGFKVAVIPGPNASEPIGIMFHQGGGSLNRACVRFHSVEMAWLQNDGSLGAVIDFMGDFGIAKANDNTTVLTPPECPNQGIPGEYTTGARQLPVGPNATMYEPWRIDLAKTVFGITGGITFNSRSANTICASAPSCPVGSPIITNNTGTVRFVTGNKDVYGNPFSINASKARATGNFCTDPMGRMVQSCSLGDSVAQYIAPGFVQYYPCGYGGTGGHASGRPGGQTLACGADNYDLNQPGGVKPGTGN